MPQGYSIEYGGAYAEQQQSFHELLIILITSSLLVFGVILFMFKDYRIAFIILLIAVLGIAGSFMALYFTGTPLNVGSYTGLIMIVGIIGENAIFTFLQFKESYKENNDADHVRYLCYLNKASPKINDGTWRHHCINADCIGHWNRRTIASAISHCCYRRVYYCIAIVADCVANIYQDDV